MMKTYVGYLWQQLLLFTHYIHCLSSTEITFTVVHVVIHDAVITHLEPDTLECSQVSFRKHHYKQS